MTAKHEPLDKILAGRAPIKKKKKSKGNDVQRFS